jgi:hypothetical protein
MTPKWRRSVVVPFNIEKVVKPTRSSRYLLASLRVKNNNKGVWGFWVSVQENKY